MKLLYPWFLILFIVYVPLVWWYLKKYRGANPSMALSSTRSFDALPTSWKVYAIHACFVLRLVVIGAVIVALCRPQTTEGYTERSVEGTDIVLALDISTSMLSQDFDPNRFVVAKDVATRFVNGRENDNIGLVVFAGESLSLLPLTNDRATVVNTINGIKMGLLADGTAIGNGLVSAINRVSGGKAKSKSIILLTDGTNNAGDVHPDVAAQVAREKGVRVYTIGVGTDGVVQVNDPYGFTSTTIETKIDEESLMAIADVSGGKYFRATNEKMLQDVFREIESLEKTRFDVSHISMYEENFMPWVVIALGAFLLELLLRYLVLRRIP